MNGGSARGYALLSAEKGEDFSARYGEKFDMQVEDFYRLKQGPNFVQIVANFELQNVSVLCR